MPLDLNSDTFALAPDEMGVLTLRGASARQNLPLVTRAGLRLLVADGPVVRELADAEVRTLQQAYVDQFGLTQAIADLT